jgi:hypothetical protein
VSFVVILKKTMCYSVYISTDSPENLSSKNTELLLLKKVGSKTEDSSISLLSYPNIWYAGSHHQCSCGFRHIMSEELGFSEPVDWYEEESKDIEATKQFYRIIKEQIDRGFKIDIVDKWEGTELNSIKRLEVNLSQVSENEFRFFENYLFEII